ncbi:MAG: phosphoribosylaminoimidazolesuccinocarboxamide synthase [Alphaproteobacteria bacterium]|nr:phosphoribosylaminoimidazolesuccinocarboxamide synthase [Alphaproteobacteria bacterium]MBV9378919.1 phosphoribosylaminoimidazolesuccinocarboxamide synthase [Alphaproteobacteria bacterium]
MAAVEVGVADTAGAEATANTGFDRIVPRQEALAARLDNVLADATIPELPNHYRGKVRDNYDLPDGRRILIATDRLSAFDRILTAIPCKGQVLTQIARFWFDATRDVCPNHVIDYPDPNVVVCRRVDILPVEIVVRDYLTGTTGTSIWPTYKSGRREIYGIQFPDGLHENQKLPATIITPTTKAAEGEHDEPITPDQIVGRGLLTREQWRNVSELALALFERGRAVSAERGLILVDTKYEFGLDRNGRILLADEVHTPDSSRYWIAESYERRLAAGEPPETLDKDFLRRWVTARCNPYREPVPEIPADVIIQTARIYIDAYETITGERFQLPSPDIRPLTRIRANLLRYFASGTADRASAS